MHKRIILNNWFLEYCKTFFLGPLVCIYDSRPLLSLYIYIYLLSHTKPKISLLPPEQVVFLLNSSFSFSISFSCSSLVLILLTVNFVKKSRIKHTWSHHSISIIIIKPTKKAATTTTTSPALVVTRVARPARGGHRRRSKLESSKNFTTTVESGHQQPIRSRRSLQGWDSTERSRARTSFTGSRTIRLVSVRRRDSTAQPWPHHLHRPTRLWWRLMIIIINIILYFTIIMVFPCRDLLIPSTLNLIKTIISIIITSHIPASITVTNFSYTCFFLWIYSSGGYILLRDPFTPGS